MLRWHELAKNGTMGDIERYFLAKEKIKQLDLEDFDAIKVRTKAQFIEEGERSTRYFFSLGKSRRAQFRRLQKIIWKRNWGKRFTVGDICFLQGPLFCRRV